ncbi:hypothetical protein M5K25_024479 [Dendrobium thyrsiflorum]|uniref:Ycf15 n=1 Tax=Dendrobium thyrsiflorum TaxID=117978 RepID=A0ABD0U208_DENTH
MNTFKCLTNGPRSRDSISVVHPNHSIFALDHPPIYGSCHPQNSINSLSFLIRGGRSKKEKKKKKRREEGKEGRNSSSIAIRFSSDAGILSDFQVLLL